MIIIIIIFCQWLNSGVQAFKYPPGMPPVLVRSCCDALVDVLCSSWWFCRHWRPFGELQHCTFGLWTGGRERGSLSAGFCVPRVADLSGGVPRPSRLRIHLRLRLGLHFEGGPNDAGSGTPSPLPGPRSVPFSINQTLSRVSPSSLSSSFSRFSCLFHGLFFC